MEYIFQKGSSDKTLVLFHGTGGTENDLIPLAGMVDPEANVLSVRGNVSENGMNRYFRRLAEGIFDEEDLINRTNEMYEFLNEAADKHELDRSKFIAIGYSNGANIAGSLLFHYENALAGAILHHPMVPRRGIDLPNIDGVAVFIAAGRNDPLCAPEESEELEQLLSGAGAKDVTLHWENSGHQLVQSEVEAAHVWYEKNFK